MTPKAGPASKMKKNGTVSKTSQPPSSDSDSNTGKKEDSNSDKKSSAKSTTSAKKPDRRNSISTGQLKVLDTAKKTKKLPEKVLPKKKSVKEDDDLVTKSFSKKPEVETSKPEKVHFSSSDYDDWTKVANKAKESIKSFDDLFNDNKNDDNSDKKAKDSAVEDNDGKKIREWGFEF